MTARDRDLSGEVDRLEAALEARGRALGEARRLLSGEATSSRSWVRRQQTTNLTVASGIASVLVLIGLLWYDHARRSTSLALATEAVNRSISQTPKLRRQIRELKAQLPPLRRLLARLQAAEQAATPYRPGAERPGTATGRALLLKLLPTKGRKVDDDVLEWLNAGLAACAVKDREAALDAARQLRMRAFAKASMVTVPGTNISFPKSLKNTPLESLAMATVMMQCSVNDVKLMTDLFDFGKKK